MICNSSIFSIILLLFWFYRTLTKATKNICCMAFKGSRSLSEIHSHSQTAVFGNAIKLQCPVKTNNLYVIKWFKDGKEFCRFFSGEIESHILKHNKQNLIASDYTEKKNICDKKNLDLELANVTSSGIYTCHVVFEAAKKRRLIKRRISLLVYPTNGPFISGINPTYSEGEMIHANCTASPSNPPPSFVWYINGVAADGWSMISYPCQMTGDGLCVLKIGLRVPATKKVFPKGIVSIVCEASILALPPRRAFVTSTLTGFNNSGNIQLLYGRLLGVLMWQYILLF